MLTREKRNAGYFLVRVVVHTVWNIIKNMVKEKKNRRKREKRTEQSTQKIRCFVYAGGNAGIQRLARRRCGFSKNSNGSAFCFDRLCRNAFFPLTQFEDIAREDFYSRNEFDRVNFGLN